MTLKPIANSSSGNASIAAAPMAKPLSSHKPSSKGLTPGNYLILAMVALTGALGDTLLSIGMKRLGPVPLAHPEMMIGALCSPWIIGGVLLLLGFFASYLTALSWADLTYVLPATSFGYAIIALLSKFWLHEHISPARWLGITLIVAGVGFAAQGPVSTAESDSQLLGRMLQGAEE